MTNALTARVEDAVAVVYASVQQVKDVPRNCRRESEDPPVLAESVNPKGLGDDGGEDAEEEAVCDAGDA
jgi:hypothetical protein